MNFYTFYVKIDSVEKKQQLLTEKKKKKKSNAFHLTKYSIIILILVK